ncbi:MAG: G-protein coupled receptor [Marinobacter sp.]|nr:G-protein coupled receptor [Marinobacter sp.]
MTAVQDDFGYAPTAYRSNRKAPEPTETSQQSTLFRKSWTMGSPLSEGKLSGLIPPGFLNTWDPQHLRESEEIEKRKGITELEERHTYHGRLDEECLRYATLPKISWALLWMQHGGRILFTWLFPIFLLVIVFGWTQVPKYMNFQMYFWDGIFPFVTYFFLPMLLCWGIGRFLEKKYPKVVYQEPKGPLWELNRRTGMVTLFKNPGKEGQSGEIRAQAPFHEWDGYLLSLPDHQGNIWYRLVLVHKTQEWALAHEPTSRRHHQPRRRVGLLGPDSPVHGRNQVAAGYSPVRSLPPLGPHHPRPGREEGARSLILAKYERR